MSVNSLQRKKPSEQMAEYVAGRNRVNVMPRQTTANYGQPVSQGQARVAEIARQKKQQQLGVPVAPQTPAEIVGYQQARGQAKGQAAPQQGGTVLTQEQVLANNINDIIKRMNEIMSQPGNLMSPSASPYYNIYMEQYRKNAEAAEANAFARSVASTGGYGSSYATMAGQQAYRDTMEGFTELTPSLVQTKGQAMSDLMTQYQLAKGLKEELDTEAGTATLRLADGTEVKVSEEARDAYNTVVNNNMWDGTNAESLKTKLFNMGYKQEDIDMTVSMLQKEQEAQQKDTEDQSLKMINEGLADPSRIDLTQFGYTAEEIEKMDADEYAAKAKEAWLDYAGEQAKSGQLSKVAYANIVEEDMMKALNIILAGDKYEAPRNVANLVIKLDDLQSNGYLTSEFKTDIMEKIANKVNRTDIFDDFKTKVKQYGDIQSSNQGPAEKWLLSSFLQTYIFATDEQAEAAYKLLKLTTNAAENTAQGLKKVTRK